MKEELEDEKAFLAEDVNYLKQHSMEMNGKIKDAEKIRVMFRVFFTPPKKKGKVFFFVLL
jgi:hypothetical protein